MPEPGELAGLQRRFHDVVTAGGSGDGGGLCATGDLAVYAGAYAARLHDVLADDYPTLRAALGDGRFAALVRRYLRACPPRSFTLRDAGAALPGALAAGDLDSEPPPWAADLARLERARLEVFDGPDAAPLTRDAVQALPAERFPELALAWVPSSAVVPLAFAVDDLWSAIEDGAADPPPPLPAARTVLVWRKSTVVFHRTLDPDEAPLAAALARGATFGEVCAGLAAGAAGLVEPGARAVELLLRWLDAEAVRAA
jgi:hypothetical protein